MWLLGAATALVCASVIKGLPTDTLESDPLDLEFIKFLAGQNNDSINKNLSMAIAAVRGLDAQVKAYIKDGIPLNWERTKIVLFEPQWQFLNNRLWRSDGEAFDQVIKLPGISSGREVVRVIIKFAEDKRLKDFIGSIASDDLKTLQDVSMFLNEPTFEPMDDLDEKDSLSMFEINGKLRQVQSTKRFQLDLNNGNNTFDSSLTVDDWIDVPASYLRLWRQTLETDIDLSRMLKDPDYRPFVGGANDAEIVEWLEDWNMEKHDDLIDFLSSSAQILSPTQIQLLISPFVRKTSMLSLLAFRKQFFDSVDVTQLYGLTWRDAKDLDTPDLAKLLMLSTNSRINVTNLSNETEPSALFLYPSLKMQDALDNGKLTVDEEVFKAATSPRLTRGQASILYSGYISRNSSRIERQRVLEELPKELFFAMPFELVMSIPKDKEFNLKMNWTSNVVANYDRLLPSQRLSMIWRLSQVLEEEEAETARLLEVVNFAANSTSPIDGSLKLMDNLVATFISPKTFEVTSLSDKQKVIKTLTEEYCSDEKADHMMVVSYITNYSDLLWKLNYQSRTIFPLSLSFRQCMIDRLLKYLDTKRQIYNSEAMAGLTREEAYFGGPFWTGLTSGQVRKIGQQDEIIRSIGQLAIPELMAVTTFEELEALADIYVTSKDFLDFEQLSTLGSLAYFAAGGLKTVDAHFKTFVSSQLVGRRRCVCLPENHRAMFTKALREFYGEPSEWTMSDILEMGDMISLFEPDVILNINQESMRRASPYLIRDSCFPMKYQRFPGFVNGPTFETACYFKLAEDTKVRSSVNTYKQVLYQSTLTNVRIALTNVSEMSQSTSDLETNVDGTLSSADRRQFTEIVLYKIRDAYKNFNMTKTQIGNFDRLVNEQTTQFKNSVSDILGFSPDDVPGDPVAATEFLKGMKQDLTGFQIQSIREAMNGIGAKFVDNIVILMKWNENDIGVDRTTFCSFVSVCRPEPNVDMGFRLPYYEKFNVREFIRAKSVNEVSDSLCHATITAGFASSSLSVEDLKSWPMQEIYECLEVLSHVGWPDNVKPELWKYLKEAIGSKIMNSKGKLMSGSMLLLNPLLDIIAEDDADILEMVHPLSIDSLSVLGTKYLKKEITTKIASEFSVARKLGELKTFTLKNKLEVAALGNLVCGFPAGMINDLTSKAEEDLNMLEVFGGTITYCKHSRILTSLARKVPMFQKSGTEWSQADEMNFPKYGILAAGSDPEWMSKWPLTVFKTFTSEIVSHLTPRHLSALSPDQLEAIPVDSLSVLANTQLSLNSKLRLSSEQIRAIEMKYESVTRLKEIISKYQQALEDSDNNVSGRGLLEFALDDDTVRDEQLYPNIDRADNVILSSSSSSKIRPTVFIRIAFFLVTIFYVWLVVCCLF